MVVIKVIKVINVMVMALLW